MSGNSCLRDFLTARRRRLEEVRSEKPFAEVREAAERRTDRRNFAAALMVESLAVIAELKRASPSRGMIRPAYHPSEIALGYQKAGAAAISVLTEEQFFLGSLADLEAARAATRIPFLRKDFIIDEYQIYESAAAGADALLLIVAALDDRDLVRFLVLSESLKTAALVEVHTEDELRRAVGSGAKIVGINNRDLKTLEVKLETSFRLREMIPPGCLAVSESGIRTPEDLIRLEAAGFDAALIGEHLLLQDDPGRELACLLSGALAPKEK